MIKHNQDGGISAVTIWLIVTVLLLVGSLAFAGWAFLGRQDYKNNTDKKIADAVTIAKQKEDGVKDVAFAEAANRLAQDAALRARLGQRARERARREFTADLMARRTVESNHSVVDRAIAN